MLTPQTPSSSIPNEQRESAHNLRAERRPSTSTLERSPRLCRPQQHSTRPSGPPVTSRTPLTTGGRTSIHFLGCSRDHGQKAELTNRPNAFSMPIEKKKSRICHLLNQQTDGQAWLSSVTSPRSQQTKRRTRGR